MPTFQTNDHKINYELLPRAVPEDTLLIHGNLASNRWWDGTVRELKNRYGAGETAGRLAMAEWLGCGKSSPPISLADLSMESLAKNYVALVRGLGLSDVCIVGHSTGGLIALYAVLEAPELFSKILLLDSVGAQGVRLAPEMLEAFEKMRDDRDFCATVMASTIHNIDTRSEEFRNIVTDTFEHVDQMVWTGIPEVLSKVDIRMRLKSIQSPVLILHGEHDPIIPKDESKALKNFLPNAEYVELKGQGHSCNVENPSQFCELLCDFLYE